MVEKMSWSARVEVANGPRLSAADVLEIEAYDKVGITLAAGAADVDVDLQPAEAGQVVLLMIKTSARDPAITYSPDAGATKIPLDAPLILIGTGAISLLGADPKQLQLANGTANDVEVEILVGRDATP